MGTGGLFGQGSSSVGEGSLKVTRGKEGKGDPSPNVSCGSNCAGGQGRPGK